MNPRGKICIPPSSLAPHARLALKSGRDSLQGGIVRGSNRALLRRSLLLLGVALGGCAPTGQGKLKNFNAFALIDGQSHANTADADCDKTCQARRLEFRYVVYVGKEIYCYWNEKKAETGLDYEALARTLQSSIVTDTSLTDYYRVLRRWAGAFHDGHVNVMPPGDLVGLDVYSAPVRIQAFAPGTDREKVVVTESDARDQLVVGDEITAVDGVPVRAAIDGAEPEASGSTRGMRRSMASRRLLDALGTQDSLRALEVDFLRKGTPGHASLFRRVAVAVSNPSSVEKPAVESTGAELLHASVLPGGIGYLRIDAFMGSEAEAAIDAVMRSLVKTKGLILDLRANGGGTLAGNRIIGRLTAKPVTRYEQSERLSPYLLAERPDTFSSLSASMAGALFADWHAVKVEPIVENSYLGKPVVALTGGYCFSACDTFVAGLKANKLATIMGEPTGGGTGTPLVFGLPTSGFHFRYGVVRGRTANREAIEGHGTIPDIALEPSADDLLATNKDSQLEQVIAFVGGLSPAQAAGKLAETINQTFGHVGHQGTDVAPTILENRALLKLISRDELL